LRLIGSLIPVTLCVAAWPALAAPPAAAAAAQPAKVDFNRDIRPILSDNCFTCHGPDESKRMAGLRLDVKESALAVAESGKLVQRVANEKPALRMPPPYSGRKLTDAQVQKIKDWVAAGAVWNEHWAYVPPRRADPPAVQLSTWSRNPIDTFVLARLEKEGLKPSPEADRGILLRRLSFDLTGLPPTPAEVDAFLADKSPDAYEKQVERLLASPHYGERMAMQWLDLARYADTHGYHIDSAREMWHWRDWVIDAYNRNMPFDQFTVWQLAGDLLPNATREQKLASGFNRNHMINFEGGAIPEEYQNEYVVDRIDATSTVWMGTTMGCARCHDHKYDPIRQRDFYSMGAFFNTISEVGLDGSEGNAKPYMILPDEKQQRTLSDYDYRIETLELKLPMTELNRRQKEWEKDWNSRISEPVTGGLTAWYELDGSLSDISGNGRHGRVRSGDLTFGAGPWGRWAEFDGRTQVAFPDSAFDPSKRFSVAFRLVSNSRFEQSVITCIDDPATRKGFEVVAEDAVVIPYQRRAQHLSVRLSRQWPADALAIRTRERLLTGKSLHLTVTYDGSGSAAGLRLWLDGKPAETEVIADKLSAPVDVKHALEVGSTAYGRAFAGRIDDLRIYNRVLPPVDIGQIAIHYPAETLAGDPSKKSKDQEANLRNYFLLNIVADPYRSEYAEWKALVKQREEFERDLPTTMVMREMDEPRATYVLARGDYREKRDKVTPSAPSFLPPLSDTEPANRLALARWLVDPNHPLTSRVAVNRLWQMHFGIGIVKTSEDFGSQGDPPSNQQLLDWLATEFIRSGWDVKAMHRLILTSAAYRQTSKVTPALLERDPENRLIARGPRYRLPAEMVRDNALAVSGLLNPAIGGPPVLPYQPPGLWEELAFGDVFSAQAYVQSHGEDLYRRGMYTFWKRTVPPAMLTTFDAPDREKCTARRPVTNTPLQALALWNDPTFLEAARALAQRTLLEAKPKVDARVEHAFRLATLRQPDTKELNVLRNAVDRQLTIYAKNESGAESLVRIGESKFDPRLKPAELAAWMNICSIILNLDETVTKE
jgi:mono/diheme cytochrome c family protein